MSEQIKETEMPAPTLTFEPFAEEEAAQSGSSSMHLNDDMVQKSARVQEIPLTEEEEKIIEEFASKIELSNSNMIIQYGSGAQKKIADFSESALDNVRTKDLGEIGGILSNVVMELKNFEAEDSKGFLGIFKRTFNKIANMKTKYDKAEIHVTKICTVLENHQIQLLKDVAMLDKMYNMNKVYFKELSMYILAGKRKLDEVRNTELPVLEERAKISGLPEDAQAVNDLSALCSRFEKKLHDLELTRMISIQMAPQIRLVQNNDTLMSDKIQSTLVNTIPLWKSQMVLALGIANSKQAAEAQRKVTDMTNDLLRKNAETLKMASIDAAKESERGIVDIETLANTNQSLISTLEEVTRIQEEGRRKRAQAETELLRMEGELKQKLLEIRK
ncbi:toxic anion resistance protein [Aminipila luticellarii]|uniref:Toxic anion resistance protein n=1 Tax=Aminipila luticellarii TaxID=2507160 RepID=A0A410PWR3_9FIRM|nr:toxic anion resistance protein [Aminipila luticellarii]QAT43383.1 toxic anion resistance protein [Aminipila luticellarii]